MATEAKVGGNTASVELSVSPQEKKKLKRPFIFQGQEYDLNNLTAEQTAYLKKFPDEVPFLK